MKRVLALIVFLLLLLGACNSAEAPAPTAATRSEDVLVFRSPT